MSRPQSTDGREVVAFKVHQWLKEWEKVPFDAKARRRRPDPHFYLFTLSALDLKALSGIYRRTTAGGLLRSEDLGIERRHDEDRSEEIREFIKYGPWADLGEQKRQSGQFDDLRKPGWLPTAIVVNILKPGDKRHGEEIAPHDLITVRESNDGTVLFKLPRNFSPPTWKPARLHPIEVIDGQHRLWAFEGTRLDGNFQLPVVAFHGLDISWQAYLFWTINIKPKRINASLAFDLYPLLRTEDWLEKADGHHIYRETRAQELTEGLWAHPQSPWHHRINMLGEPGVKQPMVTQAAWIRSLLATYVRAWEGKRIAIGGLFGAPTDQREEVLPWSRAQQVAFLIFAGRVVHDAVKSCRQLWAQVLRRGRTAAVDDGDDDPAFSGPHSLFSTDQGIRGLLYVTNDLCYVRARQLKLAQWAVESGGTASDERAVSNALQSLKRVPAAAFITGIATGLAKYDWRTSSAPGLQERERVLKAALRGSGGYKELRRQLLRHLSQEGGDVGATAKTVLQLLKY